MPQLNLAAGSRVQDGVRHDIRTLTLAGDVTMTTADAPIQVLDPGGSARDIDMPAEAGAAGLVFYIINSADGAENLVVKDSGDSTVATIGQNEGAVVLCDGASWFGIVGANT